MEIIKNLKEIQIVKKLFLAFAATIFLALSAKISIPFWPVPMTMQTFVVMFIGVILDGNWVFFPFSYIFLKG